MSFYATKSVLTCYVAIGNSYTPSALGFLAYGGLWVNRSLLSGSGLQGQGLESNNKPSQLQRKGTQGDTVPSSQVREQEGLGDAVVMVLEKHSLTQPAHGHNSHPSHMENILTRP